MNKDEALQLWDELYLSESKAYDYASHPMKREDYNNENSIYGWTIDVKQPNKTAGKNLINNEIPSSIVTKTIREGKTSFKVGKFLFEVRKSKEVYGEYDIYDITNSSNPINMEPSDENQDYNYNSNRRKIMLGKNFEEVKEIHNVDNKELSAQESEEKIIDEELKVQRLKEKIENEGYQATEEEIKKVEESNKIEDMEIPQELIENKIMNEEIKNENLDEEKTCNIELKQNDNTNIQKESDVILENNDYDQTKKLLLRSTQDFLIENRKLKEELNNSVEKQIDYDMITSNNCLKTANEEFVQEIQKLKEEISNEKVNNNTEKEIEELKSIVKDEEIKIFNLENELEGYKEERDNLILSLDESNSSLNNKLNDELIDKNIQIQNLEDEVKGYKEERDNLISKIEILDKEHENELEKLKEIVKKNKVVLEEKTSENDDYILTKESLLKSTQDFLIENRKLKEELNNSAENQIDYDMIASNNCLKTANEEFVQEIQKLKEEISKLNHDSEDIKLSNESLLKANKELIDENNLLKANANDCIKKEKAIDLITNINKLKQSNLELLTENTNLKEELQSIKNKQYEASKEQLDKEVALEEDNETLVNENKNLEKENFRLNNINNENEKTINGLREALDVYLKKEDDSTNLANDNALKDAKISELTRQLNEEKNKPVEKETIQVLVFDEKALLENLFIKNEGDDNKFEEFSHIYFENYKDVNDEEVVFILNEHPEFIKKARVIEKVVSVDNSDLVASNKALVTSNKELIEINKKLKEDLSHSSDETTSQVDYLATKNSLVKANQELIIENNNLKEQLDENFNAENRKLQLKNDELNNEIITLKKQIDDLDSIKDNKVDNETIIQEYNELKQGYDKLKEEISQNRINEEDLHLSNKNLLQANLEFSTEINRLKNELDIKEKAVDPDLIRSNQELLQANKEFITKINQLNQEIDSLNSLKVEVDPKEEIAKKYFKLKYGNNIKEAVDFAGNYIRYDCYNDVDSPFSWNYILYDQNKEETIENVLIASLNSLSKYNKDEEFVINGNTFLLQYKEDNKPYISCKDYLADPEIFKSAYEVSSDTVNKIIPILYIFVRLKSSDGLELSASNSKIFINLAFLACKKLCNDILLDFHQDNDTLFITFNGSKDNSYSDVLHFATLLNSYRKSFNNMKKVNAVLVLDKVNCPQVYSHYDFDSILQITNDRDMKAIQFDLKQGQVISSTIHTTLHLGSNIVNDNILNFANKNLYQSGISSNEFKEFFKNDIEDIDNVNFVEYRYVLWKD